MFYLLLTGFHFLHVAVAAIVDSESHVSERAPMSPRQLESPVQTPHRSSSRGVPALQLSQSVLP